MYTLDHQAVADGERLLEKVGSLREKASQLEGSVDWISAGSVSIRRLKKLYAANPFLALEQALEEVLDLYRELRRWYRGAPWGADGRPSAQAWAAREVGREADALMGEIAGWAQANMLPVTAELPLELAGAWEELRGQVCELDRIDDDLDFEAEEPQYGRADRLLVAVAVMGEAIRQHVTP